MQEVQLKFRPQRGGLDQAMSEMVKPYGFDVRINWDTHIVYATDTGVYGFTDSPVRRSDER